MSLRTLSLSAFLSALVVTVASAQGNPYAPAAVIPEGSASDPDLALAAMFLNDLQIPPRSAVPIPPYPGAVVIQTMAEQVGSANGEEFTALPVIVLVTTDPVDQVAAYYAEHLPDWNTKTEFGQHYFWEGEEDFNPFDMVQSVSVPSLVIMDDMDRGTIVPGAAAELQVRYQPGS